MLDETLTRRRCKKSSNAFLITIHAARRFIIATTERTSPVYICINVYIRVLMRWYICCHCIYIRCVVLVRAARVFVPVYRYTYVCTCVRVCVSGCVYVTDVKKTDYSERSCDDFLPSNTHVVPLCDSL